MSGSEREHPKPQGIGSYGGCLNEAKDPVRLAKGIEIPIVEMADVETETRNPGNRQKRKNWAVREEAVTRPAGLSVGTKKVVNYITKGEEKANP